MPTTKTPAELRETVRWITEAVTYDYMASQDLARAIRELHASFGSAPNDMVLDLEREITVKMNRAGLENRYDDALAKTAGTYQEAPPPPTVYEIGAYIGKIGLQPNAIQLVQMIDGDETIYVEISSPLLLPIKDALLRALQRTMPPRIELKFIEQAPSAGFVTRTPTHGLTLESYWGNDWQSETSTLEYVMKEMQSSAMKASKVFKDAGGPTIKFRVCCTKESNNGEERIVTGVILEPGVIDTTKDDEMHTEGDTYDEEEIKKGMYWWMEYGNQQSAYLHVEKGGQVLTRDDVVLLENWQTRVAQKIGDQDIPAGTWMSTERIKNDQLWSDIKAGSIKSWSIGARAMGSVEEVKAA